MVAAQPFWIRKKLTEMTREEWEAVCDGCGLCCLHKLEDEDTDEVYYTDVACRYLDENTCRCTDYTNRQKNVEACLTLTPENLHDVSWLPDTCAYRLLSQGEPLKEWHPLVSGCPDTIHERGHSIRHKCVSEKNVDPDDYEDHIIWV